MLFQTNTCVEFLVHLFLILLITVNNNMAVINNLDYSKDLS